MKITNKHVAITAAVLGLLVAGHYMGEAQRAEEAQAAAAAYDALPDEEKIALDIRDKYLKPFYLEGGNVSLTAAAKNAFKAGLEGRELEKDCGLQCLVTGEDVKKQGVKVIHENGRLGYELNTLAFTNAMFEKEYPKNGNGVPSCAMAKLTYLHVLELVGEYGLTENLVGKITGRLRADVEQKGGEWTERQQKVANGMVKFAYGQIFMGVKGVEDILHGREEKLMSGQGHKTKYDLAKEFENMCYDKGNVGMIQTLMILDAYRE